MKTNIRLLDDSHEKDSFDCDNEMLNNYFRRQAGQDVRRDLSACYVLADENNKAIGYYTLSGNSTPREDFPEELIKKLPRSYSDLPTILLGRLAIDKTFKGKGFGEYLLIDALNQCVALSEKVGTLAVMVDPIDQSAERFYERYQFIKLPDSNRMFIPIKTIKASWP
ncbi:GNAT family N-acetyltransferase [Arcticibacter tournemirensis]|uniref:GNAT family N-acetyltransferase n=1 Tax=Arcticibacter tournemirensis TaxID=699437 RepID=A0A4Q0M4L0_9SPHI|nr:GNAT family N-acetyltransferase [Arcticibacter tournemirensis]RXF67576.1 GNAT family N-acetyltransferase [Arcticibacter tournemirensis]